MGGRGSKSGVSSSNSGMSVTIGGETTDYYFTRRGGQNYYQRGIGGMPEPTPDNMTAQDFRRRVLASGADVKLISSADQRKLDEARKEDRKKTDKFLNEQWYKAGPRPRKGMRGH